MRVFAAACVSCYLAAGGPLASALREALMVMEGLDG